MLDEPMNATCDLRLVHSCVGCSVTPKCTTRPRSCDSTTKTNRTRKVARFEPTVPRVMRTATSISTLSLAKPLLGRQSRRRGASKIIELSRQQFFKCLEVRPLSFRATVRWGNRDFQLAVLQANAPRLRL